MVSIAGPFKLGFRLATQGKKPHTYKRLGSPAISGSIGLAKSNYFRKLGAVEEINHNGFSFVMLKDHIDAISGITTPKKGDIIEHSNFGTLTVDQIDPIEDLGTVFAYRITTV